MPVAPTKVALFLWTALFARILTAAENMRKCDIILVISVVCVRVMERGSFVIALPYCQEVMGYGLFSFWGMPGRVVDLLAVGMAILGDIAIRRFGRPFFFV